MALRIMLRSLTGEGRYTVKSKPERLQEVAREVEGDHPDHDPARDDDRPVPQDA